MPQTAYYKTKLKLIDTVRSCSLPMFTNRQQKTSKRH